MQNNDFEKRLRRLEHNMVHIFLMLIVLFILLLS
jgi:hypothetical protein